MSAFDLLFALSVIGLVLDIAGHVAKQTAVMWVGRIMLWVATAGWIALGILMYLIAASFSSAGTAGN